MCPDHSLFFEVCVGETERNSTFVVCWCSLLCFFAPEIERRGGIFRFFHLPQGELSPLEPTLGCGSAFQHYPCSADTWVAMLLRPLLYSCCIEVRTKNLKPLVALFELWRVRLYSIPGSSHGMRNELSCSNEVALGLPLLHPWLLR